MILGPCTLEPFGLHPHHASIARRDISSFHIRHAQLVLPCGVQAITIALSSPWFEGGAWQVRNPPQKYSLSQEENTQGESERYVRSGLRYKREIVQGRI